MLCRNENKSYHEMHILPSFSIIDAFALRKLYKDRQSRVVGVTVPVTVWVCKFGIIWTSAYIEVMMPHRIRRSGAF